MTVGKTNPMKEYTGADIKVKELQVLRKADPTQVPPNIDYSEYFKPTKSGWGKPNTHIRAQSQA